MHEQGVSRALTTTEPLHASHKPRRRWFAPAIAAFALAVALVPATPAVLPASQTEAQALTSYCFKVQPPYKHKRWSGYSIFGKAWADTTQSCTTSSLWASAYLYSWKNGAWRHEASSALNGCYMPSGCRTLIADERCWAPYTGYRAWRTKGVLRNHRGTVVQTKWSAIRYHSC